MKMGKFRITLIPGSDCETVTGRGLEKCSVAVTDPWGCLENSFSETLSSLCSSKKKILGNDSAAPIAFPAPDLFLPAPVSAFLTYQNNQEMLP